MASSVHSISQVKEQMVTVLERLKEADKEEYIAQNVRIRSVLS